MTTVENENTPTKLDFVRSIVAEDSKTGKWDSRVHTRFPPEPNGYLHIGHAKSICLNFGIAKEFHGKCNLRFDDTNPAKEGQEYVDSIIEDVKWLGWDWEERLYFASSYFQQMYDYALELIKKGKAYVCDLSPEETRDHRGTLTEPGRESPYRTRSVEENLDLFKAMKIGAFADGAKTLKAKIDMAHPNLNMRDPVMYRVLHASHHRTGDDWCIYPLYDWAHGLEDSLEGITHSICTLEFENHRPLYDWFLDALEVYHPQQIEFARLNLTYTLMSKRKLLRLVEEGLVSGWDDPRMPTLSGLRRRGYSPAAIRNFCKTISVNKFNSTVDMALLEHCLRQDLNKTSPRVMAVLNPLKIVMTNYPEGQVEELEAINNPEDPDAGSRMVPFSRVITIEREDFMEDPPKKFFRLAPGREVRLRYAYLITCHKVIKDGEGQISELHCTYDPQTRGGNAPDGRRIKATLHWVSEAHALDAEVRLYDHLFAKENPDDVNEGEDFRVHKINSGRGTGGLDAIFT
ncbi:MAG: glutamine--tRNA ligase/YqeY domain fusion protein [Planctomycetes bacterium]|nr:glutamine--tRNA ligase/YqeY domain fusion protein [Planctomycetota bacterium]